MWPFRRKPKGKHALGAAVTAIPSAVAPAPPAPVVPAVLEPTAPVVAFVPPAEPPAPEPQPPRVELGFRDGSTAALAPGSAQAKALTEIASILTHRD